MPFFFSFSSSTASSVAFLPFLPVASHSWTPDLPSFFSPVADLSPCLQPSCTRGSSSLHLARCLNANARLFARDTNSFSRAPLREQRCCSPQSQLPIALRSLWSQRFPEQLLASICLSLAILYFQFFSTDLIIHCSILLSDVIARELVFDFLQDRHRKVFTILL